jgi:hypothetical protein
MEKQIKEHDFLIRKEEENLKRQQVIEMILNKDKEE